MRKDFRCLLANVDFTLGNRDTTGGERCLIRLSFYLSLSISILVDSFLNYTSVQMYNLNRLYKGNHNPGKIFVEKNV